MINHHTVDFKKAFLGLTASFLVVLSLLLVDSAEESDKQYGMENQGVTRSLAELTQIINALEYNITALYPLHGDTYVFSHDKKIEGETCYFTSEEQHAPRFDFMFSGPREMCNPKSDLIAKRVSACSSRRPWLILPIPSIPFRRFTSFQKRSSLSLRLLTLPVTLRATLLIR